MKVTEGNEGVILEEDHKVYEERGKLYEEGLCI